LEYDSLYLKQVRWNSIKHNAENQKRDEDLLGWLYEVEVKLNMAGNDAEALKVSLSRHR